MLTQSKNKAPIIILSFLILGLGTIANVILRDSWETKPNNSNINVNSMEIENTTPDIKYYSAAGVWIPGISIENPYVIQMNGLYCGGRYIKTSNVTSAMITNNLIGEFPFALVAGIEQPSTWYSIFAVINEQNAVEIKFVPFIRVYSDNNNQLVFASHDNSTKEQELGFSKDSLSNSDFVVLTDGIPNNNKKGRLRKVTSNSSHSLSYSGEKLGLSQGAFIMLSPAGYKEYKYLGCIWNDSFSNILNFFKTGPRYQSLGRSILTKSTAIAPTKLDNSGFVSPTSRTILYSVTVYSSPKSPLGSSYGARIGADGAHYSFSPVFPTQNGLSVSNGFKIQGEVNLHYGLFTWYAGVGKGFSSMNLQIYGWTE